MFGKRMWSVRPWFGSFLCVLLLCMTAIFHISCNDCKEANEKKCDTSCNRQANCVITYGYDAKGSRSKLKRVCKWLRTEESTQCSQCTNQKKDKEGRVIEQTCVVCNVCNAEFECLDKEDCKDSTPYCRRGVCSSCLDDGNCKDANRPTCTDQGCTCTSSDVCKGKVTAPVCVADKDKNKLNLCGCAKDTDCNDPELPVCRKDTQTCGCSGDSDCKDKNKPQCEKNKCVVCRCPGTQPKRPFCLKKSDGSVSCVACTVDTDCSAPTPYCDPQSYVCVACQKDTDCKDSAKPQCNGGACVSCRCAQTNKEKPICIKNSDDSVTCVACLKSSDCGAPTPTCNTKTNVCEAACKLDSDCPSPQFCDGGQCVDCKTRNDCKDQNAPRCVSGICRCVIDKDCPSALPICSRTTKKCAECTRDGDCPATFPTCSSAGVCELRSCDPANGGKECATPSHSNCRRIGRSYRCVGCAGDSECKTGERCDLSKFVCVKKT